MRARWRRQEPLGVRGGRAVPLIVAVTVGCFILQCLGEWFNSSTFLRAAILDTTLVREKFEVWRLLTYAILHGGLWHILLNMWGVYLFGSLLEARIGSQRMVNLYIASALSGGLLWFLLHFNEHERCLGASGALFGVMMAAAMLFPDARIMLLIPPVPLKLKAFVIIYAVIESISGFSEFNSGVAHSAHIGGMIGGYIYMRAAFGSECHGILSFFTRRVGGGFAWPFRPRRPRGWTIADAPVSSASPSEIDRILDKISEHGVNSLTEREMELLRQARRNMRP